METLVRRGRSYLHRWVLDPGVQQAVRLGGYALAGFCLSAGSLLQGALPLVMGLVWACRGLPAILAAVGGSLGYWLFWEQAGQQGLWWTGLSLGAVLLLGDRRLTRELPLLVPSIGMLTVSAVGLGYQLLAGDTTGIALYLLRVALGGAAPWLFRGVRETKDPVLQWLSWGLATLALAQILPFAWLGLGYVSAGAMSVAGAFPCAALTGLALDLAGITPVPMTAVAVLAYLLRFLPGLPIRVRWIGPGILAVAVMGLLGNWDFNILPGLCLGGLLGIFVTEPGKLVHRRGQTGAAQVHLEIAASVLAQTQQLLMEVQDGAVDTDALLKKAAQEACNGCALRKNCTDRRKIAQLSGQLLYQNLRSTDELPVRCRKSGRVLAQFHRAQEQMRTIHRERQQRQECRAAVIQQYQFLSCYLHDLSDRLSCREEPTPPRFEPVVCIFGNRTKEANGDRCVHFSAARGKYYIILCDGMGTGMGAVQEAKTAIQLLKRLLTCGFPAEHALRSLNSLCALRERACAVTVDLAEISLDSGKAILYKWGAAASYLISTGQTEKVGGPGMPPGFRVEDVNPSCYQCNIGRGRILLLASDGLSEAGILRCSRQAVTVEQLAQTILEEAPRNGQDDATLVTVQLLPT